MSRRSRSRRRSGSSRRQFLLRAGAGGALLGGAAIAVNGTGAFSSMTNGRASDMDAASDPDGVVGMLDLGPVTKDERMGMVELTNNWAQTADYTIALDNCSEGTLYDNVGGSGCVVYITLAPGGSRVIDIEAEVEEVFIDYTITATGTDFSFSWAGSVESQKDVVTYLEIRQPDDNTDKFTAVPDGSGNVFEVKDVDIQDKDGDDDLAEVKYEVYEGTLSGELVGEKTVTFDPPVGDYKPGSDPAETIQPDSGYSILADQLYTLKIRAADADGNFVTHTLGNQEAPPAILIDKPDRADDFTADIAGNGNAFYLGEVDVKDNDGDDDLVEVKYVVHEGSVTGDVVGEKTVSLSPTGQYQPGGDPAETIDPDSGVSIWAGQKYTIEIFATDADDNTVTKSFQQTTVEAVEIKKPDNADKFVVVPDGSGNRFEIEKDNVEIKDKDGDADLVEVYYEVFEGSGTGGDLVAEKTVSFSPTDQYKPGSEPAEAIDPDAGYSVQSGQTYTLRVTGTDDDGHTNDKTFENSA